MRTIPASAVDCVLDIRATVGEGAIWSGAMQRLLWVDIPAGRVNRFDPATGANEVWKMERPVGCVAETASGRIVAALTDGFHLLDPADGGLTPLGGPSPGDRGHRFNDGTTDPAGRFLAGTMPLGGADPNDATGTLYAFDGSEAREVMRGFHVINGLAFSPDGRTAYVSDSFAPIRTIWAFDYAVETGEWSNRRVLLDTADLPGRPDGGAVDSEGGYWMAGVGGWCLNRITPEGRVDTVVEMPVERPTRIAFGGPDLGTLFVTSIRTPGEPETRRPAGSSHCTAPG